MDAQLAGHVGLGPIDQVAYAVANMERALGRYEAMFGPFAVTEVLMEGCDVRGHTADIRLLMAINRSSPVEIELIQPVAGEYAITEHLRAHGEGLHHVRFRLAPPVEFKIDALCREGFATLLYKRFEQPPVAFAYLQTPPELGGSVIELLETF